MLLLTQDQTQSNFVQLVLRHFEQKVLGIVAHAPTDIPGLPGKKQPLWPHPVLVIAGGESSRFNQVPDMQQVFMPARAAGAQCSVAIQPYADQEFFPWFDVIIPWADAVIAGRLQTDGSLVPIDNDSGFLISPYHRFQRDHTKNISWIEPSEAAAHPRPEQLGWMPNRASALALFMRQSAELQDMPALTVSSKQQTIPAPGNLQLAQMRIPLDTEVKISAPATHPAVRVMMNGEYIGDCDDNNKADQLIWRPTLPGVYIITAAFRGKTASRPPGLRPSILIVGDEPELETHRLYEEPVTPPPFPALTWSDDELAQAKAWLAGIDTGIRTLRAPLHAQQHQQFLLEGAADGDDAIVTVSSHNDQIVSANGYVPAWNQDTFDAGYGFHFRGGAGALWQQRHIFPIKQDKFITNKTGMHLHGTWQVRRNRWQDERLPAANHHTLPGMPGAYSNYDYLEPEVHRNERPATNAHGGTSRWSLLA